MTFLYNYTDNHPDPVFHGQTTMSVPPALLLIINLNVANVEWGCGTGNDDLHRRWKQTHGPGRWPKLGINYRVVVLAIVFNCGDA